MLTLYLAGVSAVSGPNGNIDWLNCGINNGGWNPPYVQISDLITQDLATALNSGNSPFTACSAFIDQFYQYGQQFNSESRIFSPFLLLSPDICILYLVPPIMLASFAMQESSCNPNTVGGAGEQGLMQLTVDKCGEAPGGNCQDVVSLCFLHTPR